MTRITAENHYNRVMKHTLPDFANMLSTLVGSPSVSCTSPSIDQGNLDVINHLANWLEPLGFQTEVTPLPNQPNKGNLVATLGSGDDGLVLAGHTDTVPFDDGAWTSDPFKVTVKNDAFYGLGTCDMKGFFPLVLDTIRELEASNLSRPLTIVATSDEESSMAGARLLVEQCAESGRPKARYAIIGEPTGLVPVYAHKGIMMLAIRLHGHTGHSSDPGLGCNALDAMHAVMGELLSFRQELARTYQHDGFAVTVPTLNLGCLHAGDNPNRICGDAELQIDLRLLPGMDSAAVLEDLTHLVSEVAGRSGTRCEIEPFYPPVPPFEGNPEGDLARSLASWSGNAPQTVAFGTEGPFLQSLGMETIVFGPGSIDQAHQPNEYLSMNHISPGKQALTNAIRRYCTA